ncbi:hypothetical protein S-PM2d182 [Synechococcus phage S-PM2]|uniref:Hypothetical-Protein / belonging to T4-LIKE GC: 868 n=1 Tax=Synechococcus phage S-PM2 TaxID=238854 RepID=Q5GQF5_BPSYP|nr:Hypothetical-Protein / belonging to T4-LIKE GC: 868 [Synechococcus phage S-PM2]CAF34247.1 Hypothetical-Protein / belonging to T4-LIKE GC: 868 [Synechococcus phage S-PM2]CFW42394.1 hypothetical protein S-PM2d182 [Synechococcus phage S-PM2]
MNNDSNKDHEIKINRGIELMLRREKPAPKKSGVVLDKSISLLSKIFRFKIEFTWEKKNQ